MLRERLEGRAGRSGPASPAGADGSGMDLEWLRHGLRAGSGVDPDAAGVPKLDDTTLTV
ncbi:hypothetical protein LNKW23_48450 [Paralimibaculum aggregatum]|uniref:Uncharacterized protein n=1 Tax=Paralimibaculum aggregatum TaxID=3036245 RepID=A0ABQ6LU73_9RHOB|nr:hypothetical protein LNKW23_48450 [Limibaculum sp. NKW23]